MGGLVGQSYYEGAYDLKPDEALIVEAKVPQGCTYWSIILTNDLYETTDWYKQPEQSDDSQARVDAGRRSALRGLRQRPRRAQLARHFRLCKRSHPGAVGRLLIQPHSHGPQGRLPPDS